MRSLLRRGDKVKESERNQVNADWQFRMYGTEDPEQSFHAEESQAGFFGTKPVTYNMVVRDAGK